MFEDSAVRSNNEYLKNGMLLHGCWLSMQATAFLSDFMWKSSVHPQKQNPDNLMFTDLNVYTQSLFR